MPGVFTGAIIFFVVMMGLTTVATYKMHANGKNHK